MRTITIFASSICFAERSRKQHKKWGKKQSKTSRVSLSYPQSTPTPIFTKPKPQNPTKIQSLNNVVAEVKKSLQKGIFIDPQIFSSLLENCYELKALEQGKMVHSLIPTNLLAKNSGISSKLVRLYASFGLLEDAHEVFDQMRERSSSAFPWNALISGYSEASSHEDALAMYFQMEEESVPPDEHTFPPVLKACAGIGSLEIGQGVHRNSIRSGFGQSCFVLNPLIDMYAKCGDMAKSKKAFDCIETKDSISWNSMLSAYLHHGLPSKAVMLFREMIVGDSDSIDSISISTVAPSSTLKIGEELHAWSIRRHIASDLSIAKALIKMYSNQQKLASARAVFDNMRERDLASWNAIISANRKWRGAAKYFEEMEIEGCEADEITFGCLLSACAEQGLVEEGERVFAAMAERYKITPRVEHYGSIVDMYGRAGFIDRAYEVASSAGLESAASVWRALLYGCYLHSNATIGAIAARKLFELEPRNWLNVQMMIRIYVASCRFEDARSLQDMILITGDEHGP